jgi:hypothetical protein
MFFLLFLVKHELCYKRGASLARAVSRSKF